MVGPVLLKQDRLEATTNVEKRLEFIQHEMERVEKLLTEIQDKQDKTKNSIVELQIQYQAAQKAVE
jgi:prefoldin beta subunit